MQINIAFNNNPAVKDSFTISRKLGQGKFSVYELNSPKHRESFALKVFPKNTSGATQYQKEKLMLKLSHPNIIQSFPMKCERNDFYGLLTEYISNGDFFELTTSGAISSEALVRTYFHQLVQGIEYMHSQGVAHLDLKLENLMAGSNYDLKIIDFDQAQSLNDKLITSGGSNGYRAPEVQNGSCSNLAAADVFSAGVILYAFMAKEFPFMETEDPTHQDVRCYSTFVKNNNRFWTKKAEAKKSLEFFSQDFIELVNGMLHPDSNRRLKIKQIKNSKWYQGPIVDGETLRNEIKRNLETMKMRQKRASLVGKLQAPKTKDQ